MKRPIRCSAKYRRDAGEAGLERWFRAFVENAVLISEDDFDPGIPATYEIFDSHHHDLTAQLDCLDRRA